MDLVRRPSHALFAVVIAAGCIPWLGTDPGAPDPFVGCNKARMKCEGMPHLMPGLPAMTQIFAGWRGQTCGLTADGTGWCWLGGATGRDAAAIPGGYQFVSVGGGDFHTCALKADGRAYCWGESGALLCGPSACSATPVIVGTRSYRALTVGKQHTCALDQSGAAFCWGLNWMGATGNLSNDGHAFEQDPIRVSGGLQFTTISAGYQFTCALTVDGALYCWGYADAGQLASGDVLVCAIGFATNYCSAQPLAGKTSLRLAGVAAGMQHACALTDQQRAICWGDNGQGQLGIGGFGGTYLPSPMTDARAWSQIVASGATCGIAVAGGAYCWGSNAWGLLGTGAATYSSTAPQLVAGAQTFRALSGKSTHTCGLTAGGAVYCWGLSD